MTALNVNNAKRTSRLLALVLVLGSLGAVQRSVAQAAPTGASPNTAKTKVYKFASADFPGAAYSAAYDVYKGTFVGLFNYPGSGPLTSFTVKNGIFHSLAFPGGNDTQLEGINSTGNMVGTYTDLGGAIHGFLYAGGKFTTINNPYSAGNTTLHGINDSGAIVGTFMILGDPRLRGFMVDGNGSPTLVDYPGAFHTEVQGINSTGDVVGYWIAPGASWPAYHAFRLSHGSFTTLDYPGALATIAFGINDDGDIAGWYYTDGGSVNHGFVYSGGTFRTIDVPGATSTLLTRIKNNLQITGLYVDTHGETHGLTGH